VSRGMTSSQKTDKRVIVNKKDIFVITRGKVTSTLYKISHSTEIKQIIVGLFGLKQKDLG
jgi:hypothetical protein